ncbi:EamA family transporter [Solirubrobacter ginsenosidimutans]|uniref:EamA family transporter n=1 Tax=Solirubrobacter ginsenosidimutans TaxID=490573 RepID=A0A9X3S3D0_9ACTN|nr:EamA family transporter [Solirubrobacter ginsenosidimutans]MDA0165600.1 EamA family transporter [Solirubrobacter ginsenosidimutans]
MTALEASARALPGRAEAAPPWKIWTALWIVYIVWGSTYLAIALMVETIPPLLGAGTRFIAVGLILLPILAWRRGASVWRPTRAELLSAGFVGLMLPGANAVISVAEKTVPSGLAALLVASIPLWVILLRRVSGERISWRSIGAVLVGFGGLVLLLHPSGDATIIGLLACVGAALMWAIGSFASPRISLPRDPLVSTAWQSLLGGMAVFACGLIGGEVGDVHFAAFSGRSIFGLLYLITFGSLLAFTSYAWLLQNAPISKVSTYAYVNPVVAIALGWLFLDEGVSATTIIGALIIVGSVALVIRSEAKPKAT